MALSRQTKGGELSWDITGKARQGGGAPSARHWGRPSLAPAACRRNRRSRARPGVPANPLRAGPFRYGTAEGLDISVEVVARYIEDPMALTFLPSREMLIVTRKGELRLLAAGANRTRLIEGGPVGVFSGES